MSAINSAFASRQKAVQQLVDALGAQLESKAASKALDAAVAAAIVHWEKVCEGPMEPSLLEDLRAEALKQIERRRNRPPQMHTILNPVPTMTDVGYGLGLYLDGVEGTWHRLWAILSLTFQFGENPEGNTDCEGLRLQFEQILGRRMQLAEWIALVDHARAHAATRRSSHGDDA
ncbi:hypothetical protein [Acidovorax sp.]|uniref:hypothetical protein n=1 Tax=Acidovorax sp. TaxID=1872122 RepID=UPI00391F7CE4